MVHCADLTRSEGRPNPTTTLRLARPEDLKLIISLHRPDSGALGFIPRFAISQYIERKNVIIGQINADDLSYLLWKPVSYDYPGISLIHQACVRFDARHHAVGRAMVQRIGQAARLAGASALQLWCRSELEANCFWNAIGFEPVAIKPGGGRRRIPLIGWRFPLITHARLSQAVIQRRRSEAGRAVPLTTDEQRELIREACSSGSILKLSSFLRSHSPR